MTKKEFVSILSDHNFSCLKAFEKSENDKWCPLAYRVFISGDAFNEFTVYLEFVIVIEEMTRQTNIIKTHNFGQVCPKAQS